MMPNDQRQQQQAGRRRRHALDDLQVQRQRGQAAEHAHAEDEVQHRAEAEGPAAEQPQRDQGVVAVAALVPDERRDAEGTDDVARRRRRPRSSPTRGPARRSSSSGTRPTISASAPGQSMRWSRRVCGRCRLRITSSSAPMPIGTLTRNTQRQPAMPRIVSWPARKPPIDRAEHARRTEDGEEVALVLGPLPRRHDVADDRQRQREQAAGAEALERAEGRELVHRGGEAAQRRAEHEDGDGGEEEAAGGRRGRRACRRAAC